MAKAQKRKWYERFSERTRKVAAFISAVTVIIGALVGVGNWLSAQLTNAVASQMASVESEITEFRTEVQENQTKTEVQITRLELMTLIDTQPENVAEIEKVARHYFYDLKADWYMTGIYSAWARKYGGDINIIVGVD